MVSLIPRHASLAVSGTPARTALPDLAHVLRFCRSPPLYTLKHTWDKLLKEEMVGEFVRLMRCYCVRTMKGGVRGELTIPGQKRWVVGVELGRVERHVRAILSIVSSTFFIFGADEGGRCTTRS